MSKLTLYTLMIVMLASQTYAEPIGRSSIPTADDYEKCKVSAAISARADGLDFWAAMQRAKQSCKAAPNIATKTLEKKIYNKIAQIYAGE